MITIKAKGDWSKTIKFLEKSNMDRVQKLLEQAGKEGVAALEKATPIDTGKTAGSWKFEVERNKDTSSIVFSNTNLNKGVNIALILQYGHGTGTGGWVEGRDYINPALQPVFDELLKKIEREVSKE